MAFYDRIARQWHAATGFHGGAFKQFVLNDLLIDAIGHVHGRAILELGAGNGYFLSLMLRRYSGQRPARLLITDQSQRQLDIARRHFRIEGAEYAKLDVCGPFDASQGREVDGPVRCGQTLRLAPTGVSVGGQPCRVEVRLLL